MTDLLPTIEKLEKDIFRVKTSRNDGVVRFGDSGFKNQNEPDAWLNLYSPSNGFSYVVDVHIVLEHTDTAVVPAEETNLAILNQVHKWIFEL